MELMERPQPVILNTGLCVVAGSLPRVRFPPITCWWECTKAAKVGRGLLQYASRGPSEPLTTEVTRLCQRAPLPPWDSSHVNSAN